MAEATFETPDGEEIEIDGDDVVRIGAGEEPETTVIELDNGQEVVVAATAIEVVAELDLDPLEHLASEDEDEAEDGDYDD
ncbi:MULTISPECIES: hypothetical protein [unclassified Novosphingobium]|uniref:hypothetical protein n=1 Tax=unclassified Novosphingobium TaxID=2644732 RepID=UPI0013569DF5|nr:MULTISPECIES: hypothetical protein [unclassified Novosphingobium]